MQALGLPHNCVQNFVLENDPVPRAMLSVDPTFEMLKEWSAVKGLLQLRGLLAGEGSPLSPGRFLFESVGQVQLIKWTPEGELQQCKLFECIIVVSVVVHITDMAEPTPWVQLLMESPHTFCCSSARTFAAELHAGGSEVVPLDAHEIQSELSFMSQRTAATAAGATAAAGAAGASDSAQSAGGAQETAAAIATGGLSGIAAAVSQFVSPLRGLQAWLDHHHGSYAQELEAAALTGIKQQVAQQQKRHG